jgi:putative endonuclease
MQHCVYIIYSKILDKFYVGETSDIDKRLVEHKTKFYETSFTAKAQDWILFFKIVCKSKIQALKIEKHIKSMKIKNYIFNLKKYSELVVKLKGKYK